MKNLIVRITKEQEQVLRSMAISAGFKTKSEYVRCEIFKNSPIQRPTLSITDDNAFEIQRSERRSFFCPNKTWYKMQQQTGTNISVSEFIRQAIEEKLNNN